MSYNQFIVTGANSGLGAMIANELTLCGHVVYRVGGPEADPALYDYTVDLADDASVEEFCDSFLREHYHPDQTGGRKCYHGLINCAGVNYIEWFQALDWDQWDRLMSINAKAPAVLAQKLGRWLIWPDDGGVVLNIVSNASHMPMTNSLIYNASKAAEHMVTMQMAHELRPHQDGLTIFGISPNKLKGTGMSEYIESRVPELRGWTPEFAREYQMKALKTGEETDPNDLCEFVAYLMDRKSHHKWFHGCVIPYGA